MDDKEENEEKDADSAKDAMYEEKDNRWLYMTKDDKEDF